MSQSHHGIDLHGAPRRKLRRRQCSHDKYFSLCRQAKCVPLVATQSISSLQSTLPGEAWRTLLQTFRTKIFLALSDEFSARIASELCGQEDKWRVNYNISESGHDSRVSYLTGKPLA